MAPCLSRTTDACSPTSAAWHQQQQDNLPYYSAAGGRGSSYAPPVGPADNNAAYSSYEATSAFYRKATFTPNAESAETPLTLTQFPLEPFGGDIRKYPAFRNRFLDVVESHPELRPRDKLQYLLQYLEGEPHTFADGLQLTDVNYYVVVDKLEETYGNEDMLRSLLLREFVHLRPPSNDVDDLFRFYQEASWVTKELKQLGDDISGSGFQAQILMGLLSEKLRFKLIEGYGCNREMSVSNILTSSFAATLATAGWQ